MNDSAIGQAKSGKNNKSNPKPLLPDKNIIAGSIWPPIEGRAILDQLHDAKASFKQTGQHNWLVKVGKYWKLSSYAHEAFTSYDAAVQYLVRCVPIHKKLHGKISNRRCIAIMETGRGNEWRVWQITAIETSLAAVLQKALRTRAAKIIAESLLTAAENYQAAFKVLSDAEIHLPLNLDTIGFQENNPVYIGFIPEHLSAINTSPPLSILQQIEQAFKNPIAKIQKSLPIIIPDIIRELEICGRENRDNLAAVNVLRALFNEY
jgi:hypothetical protein